MSGLTFWIDVANSPHPPLFGPIAERLCEREHHVFVTAWDRAQTVDLARSLWPDLEVVGEGSERAIGRKGLAIWRRAARLRRAVASRRLHVALSHNSYSQLVAARLIGIPAITMMDYEHQPANHLAFRLARWVILPRAFPGPAARRFGAAGKVLRYPGTKEEVALGTFRPDPGFRRSLGLSEEELVVVCRPAPEGALYHRGRNDLFDEAVRRIAASGATVLLSPRAPGDGGAFAHLTNVRVLEKAVPGADLMFHADAVVGAGGTMTREAAVLGTPAYTLFAGRLAAVDRELIESGLLVRVASRRDLERIVIRRKPPATWSPDAAPVHRVAGLIEEAARAVCQP